MVGFSCVVHARPWRQVLPVLFTCSVGVLVDQWVLEGNLAKLHKPEIVFCGNGGWMLSTGPIAFFRCSNID